MSDDLHARLVAVLDEEQARAEKATPGVWKLWGMSVMADTGGDSSLDKATPVCHTTHEAGLRTFNASHIAWQDPARTLVRVAADRRVLKRHQLVGPWCTWCAADDDSAEPFSYWPCPDVRDLAARYGIEIEP